MNKVYSDKRKKTRKRKKNKDEYTFWEVILDVLFWITEVILFPLRILLWLFRASVRMISRLFDFS